MSLSGLYPVFFERRLPARTVVGVAVVVVLLSTLTIAGWLASASADSERAQFGRNIEQRAHEISAILDHETIGIKGTLTALAASSALNTGDLRAFHGKASEISQQLGLQIGLYDRRHGRHVLNTGVPFGEPLSGHSFPRPLIEQSIGSETPIVTGVVFNPIRNRYGAAVIVPARLSENLDYLISASIDADRIAKLLDLVQLHPPYLATIVDRDGAVVARSSKHRELVGRRIPQRWVAPAAGTQGMFSAASAEGVDFRWFYHQSAVTGWTTLVGVPEDVFEAPSHSGAKLLAGATAALLAGWLAVAYCFGEGFSRAGSHGRPPQVGGAGAVEAGGIVGGLQAPSADLRATDAQQRFAIEAAGIGTWSWDVVRRQLIWSRRTREIYGLPADVEPTVDYALDRIHPADRDFVRQTLRRCFYGTDSYYIEFRVRGADGASDRWVSSKGRVERDDAGVPVFMHGAMQDITERKTGEQELVELRRRLGRAQEEERLRLAHELHDQTGQSLTAALLEVRKIEEAIGAQDGAQLACLRAHLEYMGKTIHRIARELRPPAIDDIDLRIALANHVSEWAAAYGIEADFHFNCTRDSGERLPDDVRTAIYRILQEALTNVAKHARGASAVSLIVNCRNELVQMTIEDNGCGLDPVMCCGTPAGLGLAGMRERAALVGGSLEIESSRGAGTTVFVRMPLEKRRHVA